MLGWCEARVVWHRVEYFVSGVRGRAGVRPGRWASPGPLGRADRSRAGQDPEHGGLMAASSRVESIPAGAGCAKSGEAKQTFAEPSDGAEEPSRADPVFARHMDSARCGPGRACGLGRIEIPHANSTLQSSEEWRVGAHDQSSQELSNSLFFYTIQVCWWWWARSSVSQI